MLTIYDGGSSKDEVLSFWSTLYYTSSGNQIFIMITNDGDGSGINFSASYKFGNRHELYTYILI